MLDLGGKDKYSQGQTNNAIWLKPLYGAGLDCEAKLWSAPTRRRYPELGKSIEQQSGDKSPHSKDGASQKRLYNPAPVDPHQPIEHLLRLAMSDKPEAAAAWDKLKHLGTEALPYLLTRVDSPNVMVRVKVEELIDAISTNAAPILATGIDQAKNDEVARFCCHFLARFETATNAVPTYCRCCGAKRPRRRRCTRWGTCTPPKPSHRPSRR